MPHSSELSERMALRDLLIRYVHALNRDQWQLLVGVFTADAVIEESAGERFPASELREQVIARRGPRLLFERLHFSNTLYEISGGAATTVTLTKFERYERMASEDVLMQGAAWDARHVLCTRVEGTDVDQFVRTDQGWRIREKRSCTRASDRVRLAISDQEAGEAASHQELVAASPAHLLPVGRVV
jgi:hypothetical protein